LIANHHKFCGVAHARKSIGVLGHNDLSLSAVTLSWKFLAQPLPQVQELPQLELPQQELPQQELPRVLLLVLGSRLSLHLAALLHLREFAPQLQSQVLLGCLTGLQLVQRRLVLSGQQPVFVQPNQQVQAQDQLLRQKNLRCCC
jgi:hypothetical protein